MSFTRIWSLVQLGRSLVTPRIFPSLVPQRTFRDRGILQLRCKDCYFSKVEDRWWVLCRTHQRHKQREQIHDSRKKWIVTHLTFGGRPFQKREEAYLCNLAPPASYDYRAHFLKCYSDKKKQRFLKGSSRDFNQGVSCPKPFALNDREIIPPKKRTIKNKDKIGGPDLDPSIFAA